MTKTQQPPAPAELVTTPGAVSAREPAWWRKFPLVVLVGVALVVYPQMASTTFAMNVGILALTYGVAATGWNLLGGYAGQVSFGHAVFWGCGMYTTIVLVMHGWSPWLAMIPSAAIAAALALLIGLPCFRLRGHYFSIATIAVGEIVLTVVNDRTWLAGPDGYILPIKENSWWNMQFSLRDKTPYYYAILGIFAVVTLVAYLFVRGKAGRYVRAIRDDDRAAAAVGVPVRRYKLVAAMLSAAITALAGAYQVMHVGFVDPNSGIGLTVSIQIALICVIGGAGSLWGPLVGAWTLIFLQEYTNSADWASTDKPVDLLIYGALVVVISVAEPSGIVGLLRRGYHGVLGLLPDRLTRTAPPRTAEDTTT